MFGRKNDLFTIFVSNDNRFDEDLNNLQNAANEIDDDEDEFWDDEDESLSIDDAAHYWLSSGCDEDSTFGYSEEELRDYLRK